MIPEGVWPNADERHQPWTLLAEPVAKLESQILRRTGDFDSSLVLRDAWADALLSRPVARVFAETPSMLTDMFAFGRHLEESRVRGALCWIDRFREVAEHVVALVEPETVQGCFATPSPETQKLLWESWCILKQLVPASAFRSMRDLSQNVLSGSSEQDAARKACGRKSPNAGRENLAVGGQPAASVSF